MKNLTALLVVGLVLGLVLGFAGSKAVQTTKIKDVQVVKYLKIENNLPSAQVVKRLGTPAQVLSSTTSVSLPAGCGIFEGKVVGSAPAWIVVACIRTS